MEHAMMEEKARAYQYYALLVERGVIPREIRKSTFPGFTSVSTLMNVGYLSCDAYTQARHATVDGGSCSC
jgi:hypothetical protein